MTTKRGAQPFFDHVPALPTCKDCRHYRARTGDADDCAIDGEEEVRPGDAACEFFITVRRGP